ncbi:hypothetical protein M4I21_00840 [Cellulophaga sp. 20_2_10]|uniref:NACHT domain-containing protein n=1 Tax=Cellulophaga sp. 20_2_10 TaxID=2942476 RepID=UPI00201B2EBC|nr:hypothetical protein [Cellulophaga sp. 20_2_10]MCL5244332.1 hypothetical protein [Cellulophaga sp. 20_2_10]
MNHYEKRYISKTSNDSIESLVFNEDENKGLSDVIFEFNKIILLGNPGIGKTTELKNLFNELWKEKESNGIIPILINLKFFRKNNSFEDLITYEEWKKLPSIIFILDGLDEIANIQDFISEFEIFIIKNHNLNLKFVLSCRTNIYEKYLVKITDFEVFFLKNLNSTQAYSILKKTFGINLDSLNLNTNHKDYIESPFFLNLFAKYYIEKGSLPNTDSEIWDLFINEQLETLKEKFAKVRLINIPKLKRELKLVAFVNELMQRNYIDEFELNSLIGDDHLDFIDNPFIKRNKKLNNWSFEYKQVQEYFVASSLINKNFNEILDIIKIKDLNELHPSFFNSITFLINLLGTDSDQYKKLIDWLNENQVELLFKADSNRIKDLRVAIFQDYFKKECIDKTLWITTNKTIEVSELAKFGNCEKNFDFLINIVEKNNLHYRVTISALDLLSYFDIPFNKLDETKKMFLDLLKKDSLEIGIKSQIINLIEFKKLAMDNEEYLNDIFLLFKKETNKQINSSLLTLIQNYSNIDKLFWYVQEEFLRDSNINQRLDSENVIRGNSYKLKDIILNLKSSKNFLSIIKHYFINDYRLDFDNDFAIKVLEKSLSFIKEDENFIRDFLLLINDEIIYHIQGNFISNLIIRSNKREESINFLIDNNELEKVYFFIAKIIDKKTLELVINAILTQNVSHKKIEQFRNYIGNTNDRDLAEYFHKEMIAKNVVFEKPVLTKADAIKWQLEYKIQVQNNLDILFNKKELFIKIKELFKENGNKIDIEKIGSISHKWYDNNGHGNYLDSHIALTENIILNTNGKQLNYEDIIGILSNDFVRYRQIKQLIERYDYSKVNYLISPEQIEIIQSWCNEKSSLINFDNILELHSLKSFSYKNDYDNLKLIMFFIDKYNINSSKDFLLNSLEYIDLENSTNEDSYTKVKNKINDENLFNQRIIQNIKKNNLFSFVKSKHIQYAIDNELHQVYPEIAEFFKEDESIYNENKKIEKFASLYRGNDLLKSYCDDLNSRICWASIKILSEKFKEEKFCIEKSIEYLNTDNKNYVTEALSILFLFNNEYALEYLLKENKENGSKPSVRFISFSNYDNIKDYNILKQLYHLFYDDKLDRFDGHHLRTFYNSYISNLSITDEGYKSIIKILNEIKDELMQSGSDLFYINLLIGVSNNSYVNSKSKPYSFIEAKEKVIHLIS